MGQQSLSVAQLVDRLRSGSAASAAEACISYRVGIFRSVLLLRGRYPLMSPPLLAKIAVGAGLIPLLVALLAKGGYAAYWACMALAFTCTSEKPLGQAAPPDVQESVTDLRIAFQEAGGVEAAVKLVRLPMRHPGLGKLPSLFDAARCAVTLLFGLAHGFDGDCAFRIRCVDAGLVPPLLHVLEIESSGADVRDNGLGVSFLISLLCRKLGRPLGSLAAGSRAEPDVAIPSIVVAFWNGGVVPVLVQRLQRQLPEGCVWEHLPSPPPFLKLSLLSTGMCAAFLNPDFAHASYFIRGCGGHALHCFNNIFSPPIPCLLVQLAHFVRCP